MGTTAWCATLSPILIIWLVVLFRMLGTTAEDFFSPSLEFFSVKMGLPPRFAGVTLLALGNGAADVSATINAIVQNPQEGYQMSLGALTGAGMFVGTVVAGIVIVIADGVKCRGALVRDVFMFVITLGVVYSYFVKDGATIGMAEVNTFLWMYFGFVLIVLIADVYHRAVVLPRLRKVRMMEEEEAAAAVAVAAQEDGASEDIVEKDGGDGEKDGEEESTHTDNLTVGSSKSNDTNRKVSFAPNEDIGDVELATNASNSNSGTQQSSLVATDSPNEDNEQSSPTEAFAIHPDDEDVDALEGKEKKSKKFKLKRPGFLKKKKGKISKVQQGVDTIMMALSNYGPEEGNPNTTQSFKGWSEGLEVTSDSADKPVKLHGVNGILSKTTSSSDRHLDEVTEEEAEQLSGPQASYRMLLENVDNMCTIDGSSSSGMNTSWGLSLATSWHELTEHFADYFSDIFTNEENSAFDKFFLVVELPFSFFRKLSVPIPCEDFYCRGLLAASIALAPLWLGVYCILERDSNLFYSGGSPTIEIMMIFSCLVGLFIAKFAPAEEKEMSLTVSVPIAFIGFVIAATWIDTIADLLVRLLTLLGVICRIPG